MAVIMNDKTEIICPRCGSKHTVSHGYVQNVGMKRKRRKCQKCGHTFYEDEGVK